MKTRLIALVLACLSGTSALSQITQINIGPATSPNVRGVAFEPSNPVAGQEVSIVIDSPNCGWRYEVSRSGSLIAIDQIAYATLCPATITLQRVRFPMGPLPAGEYLVRLTTNGSGAFPPAASAIDDSTMFIAPASVTPSASYTGMWNDPSAPGWGIGLLQSAGGQMFATLYAFDVAGNPVWHSVPGGVWTTPTRFEGTLLAANSAGGPVTMPYQSVSAVGHMAIQFDASGGARLTYVLYAKPPVGTALTPGLPIRYEESRNLKKLAF